MKIIPFQFENQAIRVVTDENGEPLFVGKDICQALGYKDPTTAMKSHCRGAQKLHPIPDGIGRMQDTRVLSDPDVMRLVVSSTLPAAEAFERLVFEEILPTIRKTGIYGGITQNAPTKQYVEAAATFIRHVTEDLKLAQSSVLGMYQKLEAQLGMQGLLPAYAVDASTSSVAGSSDRTAAIGTLLKQFSVSMTAVSFNKLLVREGFLAEHTRPSSKGGTKNFKVVSNLEFGKNITNPANPRETQPHWYVDKFPSLLEALHVEFA